MKENNAIEMLMPMVSTLRFSQPFIPDPYSALAPGTYLAMTVHSRLRVTDIRCDRPHKAAPYQCYTHSLQGPATPMVCRTRTVCVSLCFDRPLQPVKAQCSSAAQAPTRPQSSSPNKPPVASSLTGHKEQNQPCAAHWHHVLTRPSLSRSRMCMRSPIFSSTASSSVSMRSKIPLTLSERRLAGTISCSCSGRSTCKSGTCKGQTGGETFPGHSTTVDKWFCLH